MIIKKWWFQKETITAVHDADLEKYLSSLGILDSVTTGAYRCAVCGNSVGLTNVGAIFPRDNKIEIVCDSPYCVSRMDL